MLVWVLLVKISGKGAEAKGIKRSKQREAEKGGRNWVAKKV